MLAGGGTPLCRHLEEVSLQIQNMETPLRANAQRAVIIIMTDGEPSDGEIKDIMKTLQVWNTSELCFSCFHSFLVHRICQCGW